MLIILLKYNGSDEILRMPCRRTKVSKIANVDIKNIFHDWEMLKLLIMIFRGQKYFRQRYLCFFLNILVWNLLLNKGRVVMFDREIVHKISRWFVVFIFLLNITIGYLNGIVLKLFIISFKFLNQVDLINCFERSKILYLPFSQVNVTVQIL